MSDGRPDITAADDVIADLRLRIASLLGLIDSGTKPEPHGVIPPEERNAGPVWKPGGKWRIRAVDEDDDSIYVTTPLDWDGDFSALSLEEGRRLAMAILAACDWAERGGPEHPGKRYRVLDDKDRLTGRTFICMTANGNGAH